jgi:hypothetical protein
MEMRIVISGMGIKIPKTDIGMDLVSGCYIQVRTTSQAQPMTYGIATSLEPGGKTGTLMIGHAFTDWFKLDPAKHGWLFQAKNLVGKIADLKVSGTLFVSGTVDVTFKILDDEGKDVHNITRIDRNSKGFQLSSTSIHGKLKLVAPTAKSSR